MRVSDAGHSQIITAVRRAILPRPFPTDSKTPDQVAWVGASAKPSLRSAGSRGVVREALWLDRSLPR